MVIMESHHNGPQLSSHHDDDEEEQAAVKQNLETNANSSKHWHHGRGREGGNLTTKFWPVKTFSSKSIKLEIGSPPILGRIYGHN